MRLAMAASGVSGQGTLLGGSVSQGRLTSNAGAGTSPSCAGGRSNKSCNQACTSQRSGRSGSVMACSSTMEENSKAQEKRLTKEDLAAFLASGCKPKEQWRIGTEHEKFGLELETHRPLTFEQIQDILNAVVDRFGGERVMEDGKVIGVKQGAQSITLEPGGQVELSGAPLLNLHDTHAEIKKHLEELNAVAGAMGFGFIGLGALPKFRVDEVPAMPKSRYSAVFDLGEEAQDVAYRTCSVQVNLDFSSEEDMVRKFRASLALQPVATALFANSPFTEGKPNGYSTFRSHLWDAWDSSRTSNLPQVFDHDFGFQKYVEFALDVPMFLVSRGGQDVECVGGTFRQFLEGKLEQLPGQFPTIQDWESHLTTIYTEVRLKKFLEMRGADVGLLPMLCALPALWVGLLYDEEALQGALDIVQDWTEDERATMRTRVGELGLRTPFRDGLISHVALDVLKLARAGLQRRGLGEEGFLDVLQETVTRGVASAEDLLHRYRTEWGESVDPVYTELRY